MINLAELALLSFAGYRGTRLAVHDSLLDPVRERLTAWHGKRPESALREAVVTSTSTARIFGVDGGGRESARAEVAAPLAELPHRAVRLSHDVPASAALLDKVAHTI
ncbi:hypothetical protein [Streptomyces sp. NPDC059092]|uniref:hypothetical protein n=1 Tax=Streptomyces sp. NPDC059092 TaxID=3346725 RepID=UPI0036B3097A